MTDKCIKNAQQHQSLRKSKLKLQWEFTSVEIAITKNIPKISVSKDVEKKTSSTLWVRIHKNYGKYCGKSQKIKTILGLWSSGFTSRDLCKENEICVLKSYLHNCTPMLTEALITASKLYH